MCRMSSSSAPPSDDQQPAAHTLHRQSSKPVTTYAPAVANVDLTLMTPHHSSSHSHSPSYLSSSPYHHPPHPSPPKSQPHVHANASQHQQTIHLPHQTNNTISAVLPAPVWSSSPLSTGASASPAVSGGSPHSHSHSHSPAHASRPAVVPPLLHSCLLYLADEFLSIASSELDCLPDDMLLMILRILVAGMKLDAAHVKKLQAVKSRAIQQWLTQNIDLSQLYLSSSLMACRPSKR